MIKWFWRRFFKAVNAFSLCGYYLPLEKDMVPNLNKVYNFFLNCCIIFVKFHWNWLSAWFGRETFLNLSMYCAKFNWTKLNGQKGIRKVYLSFQVWWAKTHFVYQHPSLWKQLTRHCCNSLQWWWQMNCSWHHWQYHLYMTGRSIWSISLHD